MSIFGELFDYIRARKRYWLLPVLIPTVVVHGLMAASKTVIRALQSLRPVTPAPSRKLEGGFVAAWSRPHLRHSPRV